MYNLNNHSALSQLTFVLRCRLTLLMTLMIRRCSRRWWRHQTRSMIRSRRCRRRTLMVTGSGHIRTGAARRRPKYVIAGTKDTNSLMRTSLHGLRRADASVAMCLRGGPICGHLWLHRNGQRPPYGFPLGHFLANHVSGYRAHWIRKPFVKQIKKITRQWVYRS